MAEDHSAEPFGADNQSSPFAPRANSVRLGFLKGFEYDHEVFDGLDAEIQEMFYGPSDRT